MTGEVQAVSVQDSVKAFGADRMDPAWRSLRPRDRGLLLLRVADLVEKTEKVLAAIEAYDNGTLYKHDPPHYAY